MTNWVDKNGEEYLDESRFPEKTLGFVYKITNTVTGKIYYGKKLVFFKKTSTKTVLLKSGVKKKKRVSTLVPSDWKNYWGSSLNVLEDLKKYGEDKFTREILLFCENKGSLSYYEARIQMDERVLENQDKFYNGIVNLRCAHSHVKPILSS